MGGRHCLSLLVLLLSLGAFAPRFLCSLFPLASGPDRIVGILRGLRGRSAVLFRWTPHPVIVTIRDNRDYIRVL